MGLEHLTLADTHGCASLQHIPDRQVSVSAFELLKSVGDAKVQAVSAEKRFGIAYTAVRMLADVGTHA